MVIVAQLRVLFRAKWPAIVLLSTSPGQRPGAGAECLLLTLSGLDSAILGQQRNILYLTNFNSV